MKKLTKKQIVETFKTRLEQGDNVGMFMHCKNCLPADLSELPDGESPSSYMTYEASNYKFEYPNGMTVGIIVLWCKRCKLPVWDSRHLQPWL